MASSFQYCNIKVFRRDRKQKLKEKIIFKCVSEYVHEKFVFFARHA